VRKTLIHLTNLIRIILFLIPLLIDTNSTFAFSQQVEISIDVKICENSLDLEGDFNSQVIEYNFSGLHSSLERVSEPENVHIKEIEGLAAKASSLVAKVLALQEEQLQII